MKTVVVVITREMGVRFMARVVHCKKAKPGSFVYVGRPTKYGNPFTHKTGTLAKFVVGSVEEAVERYEEWLMAPEQEQLRIDVKNELEGLNLGCWGCKPRCHAEVLLKVANV